ncbi:glycosyltransferase family A protein [Enterococcus casseliflavus]|uniref:glycosyltransferase family A protein n=1 Tax=Enterococcus casseliflavus TaxID=37734 RepID=UPI0039A5A5AB
MITVFTPTYNRKSHLEKLYISLCNQTSKNFEWVIYDDNSFDGTELFINSLIKEKKISIRYKKNIANIGKFKLLYKAIKETENKWLICVDSDDYLSHSAIEILEYEIETLSPEYIGIVSPQNQINFKVKNALLDIEDTDIPELKYKYKFKGETSVLFDLDKIRAVEVPIIQDENFLSEEILYIELSKIGKFKYINSKYYISEYQEDGITNNIYNIWSRNIKATTLLLKKRNEYFILNNYSKTYLIKNKINQLYFEKISQEDGVFEGNKILKLFLFVPSRILYYRRMRRKNGRSC